MLADTINQVKAAEQQAADLIQNAKNQAAVIVENARNQAGQMIEDARSRAEAEAKSAYARTRQAGEEEKKRYASTVSEELAVSMKQALSRSDTVIDAILAELV